MWYIFCGFIVMILASNAVGVDFCSWKSESLSCDIHHFKCLNGEKCISRESYCDGTNDCGDNSDEIHCYSRYSCSSGNFFYCIDSKKCIPTAWLCDGRTDCHFIEDESNCVLNSGSTTRTPEIITNTAQSTAALNKVDNWINQQRNTERSAEKWGSSIDRLALILYFANKSVHENYRDEMKYELNIQMLYRLSSTKLEDVPSTELASYINAFLVMCINPRDFHGYNIIQELKNRVERENYTNPYVLLALCNAGETLTETDKKKLIGVFEDEHRTFWTGMQAVVVMALSCANKQPGNEVDPETLREMTVKLKEQQFRNGTVINLPTTALVMQALISADAELDPDNFDEKKAFKELLRNQKSDGSFGDIMNTFLITPVLNCKSLVDIYSDNCQYGSADEMTALEKLLRRTGPKIRVHYSLWIGNEKNLERNIVLKVPQNTSLYRVMEIAAELDSRFKFDYSVKDKKPYINAVSGMRDNPLAGKFWFLYIVKDGELALSNNSPVDLIPGDNDHYVMWYRRGTWTN